MNRAKHMQQLIESWILQGHLEPMFMQGDFYEGNVESYKLINGELAFKFSDDEDGEWYSWERAVVISGYMRNCALFKAAKFLYKRGWYSQFSRKTDNAPWIHIRDMQDKTPEVDCHTNFQGALMVESMRSIDRWRDKHTLPLVNLSDKHTLTLVNLSNVPLHINTK